MRSSALIIALLVSGLVGLGCGKSGTKTAPHASDAQSELAEAARVSSNVGAHFVFVGSMAEHGRETKLRGTGEVEAGGRRDHLEVESGGVHFEQFTDGPFLLLNASVLAGVRDRLPAGTRWVKIDQGKIAQAAGVELRSFQQLQNLDPAGQLRTYRKLATNVRRQGPERVRGASTVRYRLIISGAKIVEQLGPTQLSKPSPKVLNLRVPLDVWVGRGGRVLRSRLDFVAEGQRLAATADVVRLDERLRITVPAGRSVYDITPLLTKR